MTVFVPSCEFRACGTIPGSNFGPRIVLAGGGTLICQIAEPCGIIEDVALVAGVVVTGATTDYMASRAKNGRANRQFGEAARRIGARCGRQLTKDEERLHDEITKQGFGLG